MKKLKRLDEASRQERIEYHNICIHLLPFFYKRESFEIPIVSFIAETYSVLYVKTAFVNEGVIEIELGEVCYHEYKDSMYNISDWYKEKEIDTELLQDALIDMAIDYMDTLETHFEIQIKTHS